LYLPWLEVEVTMTDEEMIEAAPNEYKAYLVARECLDEANRALDTAINNQFDARQLCSDLYEQFIIAAQGPDSKKDKLLVKIIEARGALYQMEREWVRLTNN